MACHWRGTSVVTGRTDPCGRAVDRPTDNGGAHPAPPAGMGSARAVSRTLPVRSAQPNLTRSTTRGNRGGRCELLPAPWIRLAPDPNRRPGRFGRRTHSGSFNHHSAARKKSILRNGTLSHSAKARRHTLLPVAEVVLGKRRILEMYLNVVEWGPGVYGAESACRYYDETSAAFADIGRQQAARLAAVLPAPLKRRPERMNSYSAIILKRMSQNGVGNRNGTELLRPAIQ